MVCLNYNGHEVTGPFPLDSCRNSVHKLGVDVQIAWMRHHCTDETLFAYWGGGHLLGAQGADRNCSKTL